MINCCNKKDCQPKTDKKNAPISIKAEYVCYCNKVTEQDIANAILELGCSNVNAVIKATGAMQNRNCAVKNPKGVCCHEDIVTVFKKYYERRNLKNEYLGK
jgi:bacterioferritin-associated ferredoxin